MSFNSDNFIYDLGETVMTKIDYVDLVTYPEIDGIPSYFIMKNKNGETFKVEIKITKVD